MIVLVLLSTAEARLSGHLKVGSFNIRDFGQSKLNRPEVFRYLRRIVSQYDLIFLQEISDVPDHRCGPNTGEVVCEFMDLLNSKSLRRYHFAISARSGAEQYMAIFNPDKVQVVSQYLYSDPQQEFSRPPQILRIKVHGRLFFVVNIHTRPYQAKKEIYAISKIVKHLEKIDRDVLVVGDLNASGTYFKEPKDWDNFTLLNQGYELLVKDHTDTTVTYQNDYTYDRFIVSPALSDSVVPGSVRVFRFDEQPHQKFNLDGILSEGCQLGYLHCNASEKQAAFKVSDHYPIEVEFSF